jgi:hypothetical protein
VSTVKEEVILAPNVVQDQEQSQPEQKNENLEALNAPVQAKQQEQSQLLKNIQNTILEVSQGHMNEIVSDLKDGFIRLEYVNSKGKMEIDRRQYSPMTIGMNKKVVKVGKKIRLLNADIKGMGQDGGMDVGKIQQKYPDILDEDVDEFDLNTETALNEIILNYIFSEKAKIYWGIDNIDNYSLHDIMIVATLYESRNNFNPSLLNTPATK